MRTRLIIPTILIALVIGLGIGSVAFPTSTTKSVTLTSTSIFSTTSLISTTQTEAVTVTSPTTVTTTLTTVSVSTTTATPTPNTGYVTGTSTTASDVYLTTCTVTGISVLQLLIASDYTGAPVNGEIVNAVDSLGCDILGQPAETQTVYIDNFAVGAGGWLTPVFPDQAEPGGELSFSVYYQGAAYKFSETVPPIGTLCVTLHVPSGNLTHTTLMDTNGFVCG